VGIGLHDSSAALVPYLQTFRRPFMLVSTGTWCINLFPFATEPLTKHQLERDCLSYLTFRGEAVKASRVFLGGEHDHQVKRLSEHFHCDIETYKTIQCDPVLIEKIISQAGLKDTLLRPATMKATGPFPDIEPAVWNISAFTSYEEAYHQLIVDLVCIVGVSLYLVNEGKCDIDLFVDGGFGKNEIFMNALASLFPAATVRSSRISQATSLGTAMMIHPYWEGKDLVSEDMFHLKTYSATAADCLQSYYERNYVRHKKNS
jgi:sugar (pentulose or hexulose) kinase